MPKHEINPSRITESDAWALDIEPLLQELLTDARRHLLITTDPTALYRLQGAAQTLEMILNLPQNSAKAAAERAAQENEEPDGPERRAGVSREDRRAALGRSFRP